MGVATAGLFVMVAGVVGCGPEQAPDCIVKVLYGDSVYRAVATVSMPRAHRSLGEATFGNCRGEPMTSGSYTGRLLAIPGVDPDRALLLQGEGFRSFYVKQNVPRREWPQVLREAYRYPHCQHSVRFTGTWDTVDPVAMRDEGDWHATPPYAASFVARRGHGLNFQRWARIGLRVHITMRTQPVPGPGFLKRALKGNAPVTVHAVCHGDRFEAMSIRFADQGVPTTATATSGTVHSPTR